MTQPFPVVSSSPTPGQQQTPTNLNEVVEFYYDFVKPLYATVQTNNSLPQEILFEINAAFDHLTRHWKYQESEPECVKKAYSHLKRSCLDVFKLNVKMASDQFIELRKIDTSIIDNGDFDRQLIELYTRIRQGAKRAKAAEGKSVAGTPTADHAFTLWGPVFEDCVTLDKLFYQNQKVNWARKRQRANVWSDRALSFVLGILASIVAAYLWKLMTGQ